MFNISEADYNNNNRNGVYNENINKSYTMDTVMYQSVQMPTISVLN